MPLWCVHRIYCYPLDDGVKEGVVAVKYKGRRLLRFCILLAAVFLGVFGVYVGARTSDNGLAFGSGGLLFGCVVAVVLEAAKDHPES
jgi:uncharacterized membrane protein